MTTRDKLKSIIFKSLESACNTEIANAYEHVVGCGECPYWFGSCSNQHDCYEYILSKLEEEEASHEQ